MRCLWALLSLSHFCLMAQTFDLQLEQRFGAGSSIVSYVAQGPHLYFLCHTPKGSFVLLTDRQGLDQSAMSLGIDNAIAFDLDSDGNAYVVSPGTRVSVFDRQWGLQRSFTVDPPIVGAAVVGNKLVAAHEDGRLHYVEGGEQSRTLEAYPGPWKLFAVGQDSIGVLRPEARGLVVFGLIEDAWASITHVTALHPVDATSNGAGHIFVLGEVNKPGSVPLVECDGEGHPTTSFELPIEEGFHPLMIRLVGKELYLADSRGSVSSYHLDSVSLERRRVDSPPGLLSGAESVREAASKSGYKGSVTVRMILTEEGIPTEIRIEPPQLTGLPDLMSAAGKLRFRPKVVDGKAVTAPASLEINVQEYICEVVVTFPSLPCCGGATGVPGSQSTRHSGWEGPKCSY